jgi:hypothetical protein
MAMASGNLQSSGSQDPAPLSALQQQHQAFEARDQLLKKSARLGCKRTRDDTIPAGEKITHDKLCSKVKALMSLRGNHLSFSAQDIDAVVQCYFRQMFTTLQDQGGFIIPGAMKLEVMTTPEVPPREGIHPRTGHPTQFKGKAAKKVLKVTIKAKAVRKLNKIGESSDEGGPDEEVSSDSD